MNNITFQRPGLLPTLPSNIPPKIIKAAYYKTPLHLQSSWLEHIQRKQQQLLTQPKTTFSAFDSEQNLLDNLFKTHSSCSESDKKTILNFCSYLRIKANKEAQLNINDAAKVEILMDMAKQSLAKVIFLADQDPSKFASLIDINKLPETFSNIQNLFNSEIKNRLISLQNYKSHHDALPIQDASLALSVLKPLAISKLLITSSGHLNLGLIDTIKKSFFNTTKELIQYEKELLQTLDDIEHSSLLQQQIENIKITTDSHLPSNDLIRISLHLPPTVTPTDVQAKIVVLAAILSDMRQGDVGSCFATSIAILMMSSLKGKVISDIDELLTQGCIVRTNATEQSEFIPVLDISDSALQSSITINKDGKVFLENQSGYLWNSPGIISACRQLNIAEIDVEHVIKSTINRHYTINKIAPSDTTEISPQIVIKYLVEGVSLSHSFTAEQLRELNNLASFAFSAETNTPLLRAWESCVASMAESQSNNYVRSKILSCVIKALESTWPKSTFSDLTEQAKKVQNVVSTIINKAIQLRYDPQVEIQPKDTGDGHSNMLGAFTLHDLNYGIKSISAKPVQTPTEFKEFVSRKITLTKEELSKSHDANRPKYLQIVDTIQNFLATPDKNFFSFLNKAIRAYDEENKDISWPLNSWENLEHLPFRDATGNDNVPVYTTAIGINPGTANTVRPKDATELLTAFILFGRSRAQADKFLQDNDPYQRYMVDTPQHAFTLTPEDASIVDAMSSPLPPTKWVEDHLIKTGNSVANMPLSVEQKNQLINVVSSIMLPKEIVPAFKNEAASINNNANTLHLFSNTLLDSLLKITRRQNAKTRAAFSRDLTNIILNSFLPPSQSKTIMDNAARIADTNWVDQGVQHIYFSCFFNPLTKTLQLGTQDEDGNRLQALDQEEWVAYVPWEMYGVKINPSLDGRTIKKVNV